MPENAKECEACKCVEDTRHIPIESKTSCMIGSKAEKRVKFQYSEKTPLCSEVKNGIWHDFNIADGSTVLTMRIKKTVRF